MCWIYLCIVGVLFLLNKVRSIDIDSNVISILTFASRKRGVMQLPGYFGSLLNNTAAKRLDIHLYTDDIVQDMIKDCLPSLRQSFSNITVKNVKELQDNYVLKYFDSYIKSGETI